MILVWFIYGLAFFTLGLVILVYPKKGSRFDLARYIWMIGVFGLVHGLNEWLDMFIRIGGPLEPDLLARIRTFVLPASFFWLVQFGTTILAGEAKRQRFLRMIPLFLGVGWFLIFLRSEPSSRHLVENIWSRYLLCVPGTLLTAWALLREMRRFRALGLRSVTRNLALAAAAFVAYGVFAGLVVRKADFFPARILNYETFTALTGLPVQIFRAGCAVMAAWSFIRVLDIFRWETQEALRISELRGATITSTIPVFLFMTDRNLIVTFAQGKGLELLGLCPERLRGRHIREAFPCGDSLAEHCRQALAGPEFITTVLLNGASFEICYSALKDKAGLVTNVVGVALDVSARMEVQRELDEYRRKVEGHARKAAIGVLSATMAQQVAEPLTVTQLVLERALADLAALEASDTVRSSIGRGLSELSKARETLNRFMEITHSDAMVAEQPVGLYQIAKRTMSVFADTALRRKVTIAVKNMDVVPLTTISPREAEQVFYHLIQRALDAADGRTEQKLLISCAAGEGYAELSFCDTCGGIGVPQVGQDFDTVIREVGNINDLGLGLAVVKGIVTGRGGQVTVETGPGNTTVRVRLPASRVY
jgi:signal transduction histidine kinase